MAAKATNETANLPEPVEEVEEPVEVVPAAAPAPVVPGKRQLGVKEPIAFKWKVLGQSEGVVLTLLKGVEREEVDAQLDRLQKEGYYKDLRVVDINEKVVQTKRPPPPTPISARHAPKAVKAAKTKKAAAKKPGKEPEKAEAKAKAKPVAKTAKKKVAPPPKRKKK